MFPSVVRAWPGESNPGAHSLRELLTGSAFTLKAGQSPATGREEHPDDRRDDREERREAPQRHLRVRAHDRMDDQERRAIEGPAKETPIGATPPVAMLEPSHKRSDSGHHRDDPIRRTGGADQDALERSDQGRYDAAQDHLDVARPVAQEDG